MMKYIHSLLALFLCVGCVGAHSKENLYVMTIPKSGSHLLFKCLDANNTGKAWYLQQGHVSPSFFHLERDYFENNPEVKKIILVRDLRDVFCSMLNWLEKDWVREELGWLMDSYTIREEWWKMTKQEKLLEFFDYTMPEGSFEWQHKGMTIAQQQREFIERAVKYSKMPNTLVIKFEDLVGKKGGGSLLRQLKTVARINKFLDLPMDQEAVARVSRKLYGDYKGVGATFDKGQTAQWKKDFDEDLLKRFNQLYGKEQKILGYSE